MKRSTLALLGFAAAAATLACAPHGAVVMNLAETSVVYQGQDYLDVLNRWTRHDNVSLRWFDTALDATATYRSWDYRQAYVAHRAELYHLSAADRAALERSEAQDERQEAEFHVMVRATRDDWVPLGTRDSLWRITLVDDAGHVVLPSSVDEDRSNDTLMKAFWPYTTVFSRSYNIRFPRALPDGSLLLAPGTRWFELRFDGPLGHLALRWEAAPAS